LANNVITLTFTTNAEVPQGIKDDLKLAMLVELKLFASEMKIPVSNITITVL